MGVIFGKISIGVFWALFIINQIVPVDPAMASWINWIGLALMAAHAVECVIFRKQIAEHHANNQTLGYVMVFLFGALHVSQWPKPAAD